MLEKVFSLIENHTYFGFVLINTILFIVLVVEVYKKEKFAGLKEHLSLLIGGMIGVFVGAIGTLGLLYLIGDVHLYLNRDNDSL